MQQEEEEQQQQQYTIEPNASYVDLQQQHQQYAIQPNASAAAAYASFDSEVDTTVPKYGYSGGNKEEDNGVDDRFYDDAVVKSQLQQLNQYQQYSQQLQQHQ
jgi:hypothetical protein